MGGEDASCIDAGGQRVPSDLGEAGEDGGSGRKREEVRHRRIPGEPPDQPVADEPRQEAEHQHRLERIGPRSQQKVNEGERCNRKDEAVQPVPAHASKLGDRAVGRGCCEHREPDGRYGADSEIEAQHDFQSDLRPVELQVKGVEADMQDREAEGGKPQDAPGEDQPGRCQDAPRRADEQSEPEQPQRPIAAFPRRLVDGPHAEIAVIGEAGEPQDRRDRNRTGQRLFDRPSHAIRCC